MAEKLVCLKTILLHKLFVRCNRSLCLIVFFFYLSHTTKAQIAPTTDSLKSKDTVVAQINPIATEGNETLQANKDNSFFVRHLMEKSVFPGMSKVPVDKTEIPRTKKHQDLIFYFFLMLILFIGILRSGFPNYFNNMIRVFFNTSLRQNQLTDQLLQSKLPSLLFNVFFVLMSGLYLFIILGSLHMIVLSSMSTLLYMVIFIMAMYLAKYFFLQLFGWFSGKEQAADVYIFMVFLVNKFMAIILLPLTMMIYYSEGPVKDFAIVSSVLLVVVFFLFRYIRSFVLLGQNVKVSRFHFLLFILGIEILPILLICKWGMNIIGKSL